MSDISTTINLIFSIGIALFPSIGFVYQYYLIHKRQSVGTFSINVCGVLILSSFLRIGFYIYQQFSEALLCQSALMIMVQIALLRLCISIMNSEDYFDKTNKNKQGEELQSKSTFWKWRKLRYYIFAITATGCIILAAAYTIRKYDLIILGEGMGYASLLADASFIIPQLVQNLKQNRVKGISYFFVFLNTMQDALELLFVLINAQPIQFILFGILQVFINSLLILQIFHYKCSKRQHQPDQFKSMVSHPQLPRQEQGKSDNRITLKSKTSGQIQTTDHIQKQNDQPSEKNKQPQEQFSHKLESDI